MKLIEVDFEKPARRKVCHVFLEGQILLNKPTLTAYLKDTDGKRYCLPFRNRQEFFAVYDFLSLVDEFNLVPWLYRRRI